MLSHVFKTAIKTRALYLARPASVSVNQLARRYYYPGNQLMERESGDYFADPIAVAERVVRLIALHDNVNDPSAVTLNSTFE